MKKKGARLEERNKESNIFQGKNKLNNNGQINQLGEINWKGDNPYMVYVLCDKLKAGYGEALLDTGSAVSLVRKEAIKGPISKEDSFMLETITGEPFKIQGITYLQVANIENSTPHKFCVVEKLPGDIELLLGRDWLETHNGELKIPWKTNLKTVPPMSETLIEFETNEKGVRYCNKQTLGKNIICAESVVNCNLGKYCCLIINLNEDEALIEREPELTVESIKSLDLQLKGENRNKMLLSKLRLAHIKEGAEELKQICLEFNDIFKLPGDRLSETKSTVHHIPTPSIPKGRAITLKNYKIPNHQQQEVDRQVQEMLEQDIIKHSSSPYNFPILVVPKKLDASGVKKWRICIDFRKLNDVTISDSFPLPNIQEILDKLGRSGYFSIIEN